LKYGGAGKEENRIRHAEVIAEAIGISKRSRVKKEKRR